MKRFLRLLPLLLSFVASLTLVSCVTEDVPADTRAGNFESLWQTLDARYCFFPLKAEEYGLDWNEVRQRYAPRVSESMTQKQLFEVMGDMICELRDGHVNLYAAHDVARYGAWFDDYPMNYSDSLERKTLGRTEDYANASGLKYRVLDDGIGYVRCATFELLFGEGNLSEIMQALAPCRALIVDVRQNGGGLLTAAQRLASLFVNEPTVGGYICHKTGAGHQDFSAPEVIEIKPFEGLRWQKPVAVLTNRRTFSAANAFVMYLKGLPNVTIVGDRTGGGSGMPFSSELPNGWSLRFSACPLLDREMKHTESGILPDVKTDITPEDYARGTDTILETARRLLAKKANGEAGA